MCRRVLVLLLALTWSTAPGATIRIYNLTGTNQVLSADVTIAPGIQTVESTPVACAFLIPALGGYEPGVGESNDWDLICFGNNLALGQLHQEHSSFDLVRVDHFLKGFGLVFGLGMLGVGAAWVRKTMVSGGEHEA